MTDAENFWTYTRVDGDCIVWTGAKAGKGYGRFYPQGSGRGGQVYAHRWILTQIIGPLPSRVPVMHSCDNAGCVKLQHLSPGSTKLNNRDAHAKGHTKRRGTIDLGAVFGRWTVVSRLERQASANRDSLWLCRCTCGVTREVRGRNLRLGRSTSCGCYARELQRARMIERNQRKD